MHCDEVIKELADSNRSIGTRPRWPTILPVARPVPIGPTAPFSSIVSGRRPARSSPRPTSGTRSGRAWPRRSIP